MRTWIKYQTNALRYWAVLVVFGYMFVAQTGFAQAQKPDLYIGSIAVNPTVGPPGGNVELTFELRNGGQANAGPFNVSIYYSTTATLDITKATLLKSIVITGLLQGRTSVQRVLVTIPKQATVNQIAYLGVMADSGKTLSESNESNNATTTTFNVKPGPDITITAASSSLGVAVPGDRIAITYTLRNIGRANIQPFASAIYFSSDALIDTKDTRLDVAYVQALRVANSLTLIRNIYIPRNATVNQTYFIGIWVDYDQKRAEEDETNNLKLLQIKVVAASPKKYPDFVVSSFTLTDTTQNLGKNAYYTTTIKNQGQEKGYVYAYLEYATDKTFRTVTNWRIIYLRELGPGKSHTHKSYFQVPWKSPYNQTPKDYYMRVRITAGQEVSKTNNNSQVLTFKAKAGQSNLHISSFNYKPYICNYHLDSNNRVQSPKTATATLSVYNYGYAVSSAFKVGLYLSDDNKISNKDRLVAMFDMPSINPQTSVTKNVSYTFQLQIPPGPYRFAVILDPDGKVQNDEGTRTRATWLHRGYQFVFSKTLPDLTIDKLIFNPATQAETGTRITFEAWVRNKSSQAVNSGCTFRTYSHVRFADDSRITQVKFSSPNFGFPTGKVTRMTGYIDVPGTLSPRKGYLAFILDTSNVHQDANKADNMKIVPYELIPRSIDLRIVSATATPKTIAWEQNTKVDIALANLGTLKQVRYTRTCVWFSYDKVLQPQDISVGSINIDFARTPSLTGSMTFAAKRWKPGPAYLILQVDCDKRYKEKDENNNFASIPITIRKFSVDFVPSSLTAAPNHIRPGLNTTVRVEVQNKGQDKHIKRVAVCIHFSNDAIFDSKDPIISCKYTTDIYNHIGVASFTVTGSTAFLAGTRYIFAQVDSGKYYYYRGRVYTAPTYDETDEKNNLAKIPLYVRNDVDVTSGSLSVSKTIAKVGDNLTFRFQVKNVGTVATNTPFDIKVMFSDNEVIEPSDRLIRTVRIPALAAGKTSTDFTVSYALPKSVQPGERYFGLLIDTKDEVKEVDETNNIGSVKVNVLITGIDLQVRTARLDRSVVPAGKGAQVKVFSEIQNFGSQNSPAFDIGYYLSTDKLFDPGDTLLTTRKYTKVLPSTARTGQFVDTVTLTLKQANVFYILVVADPTNKVREPIKSNNTYALAVQIINRSPRVTTRPPVRAIEKQLYVYQAQGFDPDGDPLSWRLSQAPGGMLVDAKTGKITWTPQAFHGGKTLDVTLELSDGRGGVGKQSFKVTVQSVNDPPKIVSTAPQRALVGSTFTYTPRAADPDPNEVLTWVLSNAPTGMLIDSKTGKITWQVPGSLAGRKVPVAVRVTDQAGAHDTQSFSLLVAKQNSKPSIVSTAPAIGFANTTFRYQALASDPDSGDILTWSRTQGPTSLSIDASTGLVTWKIPIGLQGQKIKVAIRVRDQAGAFAEQIFTLDIKRNNTPPKITSKPEERAFVTRVYTYTPKATDPDVGDTIRWSLLKGPVGMSFDKTTGAIKWTPGQGYKDKSVSISIQVEDSGGAKDVQTYTLRVGLHCEVDSDCSSGQICLLHMCSSPGCFQGGCKDAKKPICGDDGVCKADDCAGIRCTGGEFCREGKCIPICAYVSCAPGESCVDGTCKKDKCVGVTCSKGQRCVEGKCVRDACASGKCQLGRVCHHGSCSGDPCKGIKCPGSRVFCSVSSLERTAQCVLPKPCKVDSACANDQICVAGVCVDPGCYDPKKPCPSGQVCLKGKCQKDPCVSTTCGNDEFCHDGLCIRSCAGVTCSSGQVCKGGRCVTDPCSATTCGAGKKCVNGQCEPDHCGTGNACKFNRLCVANTCIQDACRFIKCPVASQRCKLAQCTSPPACQLDKECPGTQLCVKGRCAPSRCDSSNPCKKDEVCQDGSCKVNPCFGKTCGGGAYCRNGVCVGSCAGIFCKFGETCKFGRCVHDPCAGVQCKQDEVCLKGQCRKNICSVGACKQGRICTSDGCLDSSCTHSPCPSSQLCAPASGQCSGKVPCKIDQDCLGGGVCDHGRCVSAGCYQKACPKGERCEQGVCGKDPCAGKQCPSGQYCDLKGTCRQPCNCPKGQRCGPNGCELDPCASVTCDPAKVCVEGKCEERCKNNTCKFGRVCVPGQGCQKSPCDDLVCSSGTICKRGYCVDLCSELTCPPGTACKEGQCVAIEEKVTEKGPQEPQGESTTEPSNPDELGHGAEKGQGGEEEAATEPTVPESTKDAGGQKPTPDRGEFDALVPAEGCGCQAGQSPYARWFWGLGLLLLLAHRRRAQKQV